MKLLLLVTLVKINSKMAALELTIILFTLEILLTKNVAVKGD